MLYTSKGPTYISWSHDIAGVEEMPMAMALYVVYYAVTLPKPYVIFEYLR